MPSPTQEDILRLEHMFREHYQQLLLVSLRICADRSLAEDVVQGVFIRLHQSGTIAEIEHPWSYLRRSVVTRTINAIRDRQRFDLPGDEGLLSAAEQLTPIEDDDLSGLKDRLHQAIDRLPPKARLVLLLSKFEGYSHKEIAEQLDISPKTVENQLARAISLLRNYLPKTSALAFLISLSVI